MSQRGEIQILAYSLHKEQMCLKVSEYTALSSKKFLISYAMETEAFSHICEEKEMKTGV